MRTVIDASAALNLVMRSTSSPGFMNTLEKSRVVLAPALFHAEVANALWKYLQAGIIDMMMASTVLMSSPAWQTGSGSGTAGCVRRAAWGVSRWCGRWSTGCQMAGQVC